jgi:hypothetical protein
MYHKKDKTIPQWVLYYHLFKGIMYYITHKNYSNDKTSKL